MSSLIPASRGVSVALVVGLWPTAAWAAPLAADDVVRSALSRHPDAVASASAVSTAEARRHEVGTFLANPEASVGVAVAGGLVQGTLNQPLSLSGEGWHARRAASAGIDAATGDARRTDLRVAAEARATYAWAVTTRERWSLADEAMQQATRQRQAVEAREAVGEASPLDARLARMAEAETTELAIAAHRDHAAARAALATFAPDATTADLADDPLAAVPARSSTTVRSDVAAAQARVEEAEAALARERAAVLPAVGVGAFFQRDDAHGDPGDLGPQVTVGLPLWTRNQGHVGEARAGLATARAELDALRARVEAEQALLPVVSTYADEALGRLGDFEGDARAALETIELGWTTGEIDVSVAVLLRREILDGWVAALDARQSTVEARLDLLLATEDPNLIPAGFAEEVP